jgi:hypothetical protein
VSNQNDALAGVCTEEEILAVRREGELAGLKFRAAHFAVASLNAQLAIAILEEDKVRQETVVAELKRAEVHLEAIRVLQSLEEIRIAQLISSLSEQN